MSEYERLLEHIKALQERVAHLERCEYIANAGLLQGLAPDDSGAADAHVVATRDDGAVPFGPQSYIGHYGVRAQSGVTEVLQIRPGLEGSNIVQVSVGAFVGNGTRYYYMGVGYGRARAGSAGFVNVATLHSTMPGNPNVTLAWNQEVLEVSLTGISGYTTDFAVNYIVTYRG